MSFQGQKRIWRVEEEAERTLNPVLDVPLSLFVVFTSFGTAWPTFIDFLVFTV